MMNYLSLISIFVLSSLIFPLSIQAAEKTESAILAGGCFWCVESDYEKLEGVIEVISGYTGGHVDNPTYQLVGTGKSGHIEAAEIFYDPEKINYQQILDFFWRHIDPTNDKGQFCDFGPQYRPAIFYKDDQQKQIAEASLRAITKDKPFKEPIRVELIKSSKFYPAEDYHQDYYKKNPYRYKFYRYSCGRDKRVEELWGKP